jgi:DNA-binding NtrC family response regulator
MTMLNPKTTILVIDDEEAILDFMSSMLLQAGYNVIVACNGKAAMQKLESATADIVITDLIMPEKEGIETMKEIKSLYPACGIIAMSGSVFGSVYLSMAKQLGAKKILKKPFKKQELLDSIEEVLTANKSDMSQNDSDGK